MTEPDLEAEPVPGWLAAMNAEEAAPGAARGEQTGETFADALALLKKAKFAAVAVDHGDGADWSYLRVPRASMARWLSARLAARRPEQARLRSRLTEVYDEEPWLFVGAAFDRRPASGGPA